jgi:hypothetical protein
VRFSQVIGRPQRCTREVRIRTRSGSATLATITSIEKAKSSQRAAPISTARAALGFAEITV